MDLYDFVQNKNIADAKGVAERAGAKVDNITDQIRMLERRISKLVVVNEALWGLLREATQMTEAHLSERVGAIEARYAGAGARGVSTCPKCSRTTAAKHARCMYCGTELPKGSLFEELLG